MDLAETLAAKVATMTPEERAARFYELCAGSESPESDLEIAKLVCGPDAEAGRAGGMMTSQELKAKIASVTDAEKEAFVDDMYAEEHSSPETLEMFFAIMFGVGAPEADGK